MDESASTHRGNDRGDEPGEPLHDHYRTLAEHGPGRWLRGAIETHVRDADVLVAGGGRERDFRTLAEHGEARSVTGVDTAREQVDRASQRAPNASLSVADSERLPFSDDSFDVVLCSGTLVHLQQWATRGLPEFARVLRSDGVLLLTEGLVVFDPLLWVVRTVGPGTSQPDGRRPLPPRRLERRLRELFSTVDFNGHYFLAPVFPAIDRWTPLPVPDRLTTTWYDLEYRFCNPWLRHFGGRVNVVAESPT